MSNRMRLLLLTAIPTLGATVVCLLWRYVRRSKTKNIEDTSSASSKLTDQYSTNKSGQNTKHDRNDLANNVSNVESVLGEHDCNVCNSLPSNSSKVLDESLKNNKSQVRDVNNSCELGVDNRNEKISVSHVSLTQEVPTLSNSNHTAAADILSLIRQSHPTKEVAGRNGKDLQSKQEPLLLDHTVRHEELSQGADSSRNTSSDALNCIEPLLVKSSVYNDLTIQDPAVIRVGSSVPNSTSKDTEATTDPVINGPHTSLSSSDVLNTAAAPAVNPAGGAASHTSVEFDLPTNLCGMLIGKHGRNISLIKNDSGASIQIQLKVHIPDYQLVIVEGTTEQVDKAMELIKRKFPRRNYPDLDFTQSVPDVAPEPDYASGLMQLSLPMNVQSDVFISCVVTPNHVFLQQPTHPTYPELQRLTYEMGKCYSTPSDAIPGLPMPYEVGVLCAAPVNSCWHRAQIVQVTPDTDECDIRLVDVGGYVHINGTELKQIRCDFMTLPFQAIECYLASVLPPTDSATEDGFGSFPSNGNQVLETLSHGSILSAEIIAIEADGIPYIRLFNNINNQVTDINRELVEAGVASWYEM